ncbi:3'(2'),5'-bisphosphate nucleotidase CysQ [Chlorobaculum thiosulfatiphilum]|uniref:3'(2'),5'-bisphosphate nucleotidase CysQ n=1 Tax=Chlorobaculum thiosulfatiphilum TaxID=115852 RepID=A0A5C4S842_CHLTI|nr:3'(2'),5'-bisphosphate nucleotidase CysQ [Chlorobaculum thiosulfatiphilum]TNJ38931.1 3'(2'),5'-bisphosphate nucleotidase CysQ [Chlorobaculum thiosulfatiphilum]
MKTELPDALLKIAVETALVAGKEILSVYETGNFSIEAKADKSPLTSADKLAHAVIAAKLEETGVPVLSEEGRAIPYAERAALTRLWIVDPLDGTKEFISRSGDFTVNIALIDEGQPVLGVIYVPVLDELFFGIVGDGAYKVEGTSRFKSIGELMATAIKLPLKSDGARYRVVNSRSHMNERTTAFIDSLRQKHPDLEIVQRGSSFKICMVASGEADIYPRFGPTMEWDTAAGHAIALAAGKHMVKADEQGDLAYNKENLLNPFFIVQ